MDLGTVTNVRAARTRADLALAEGERFLAGGSWLFSEPQPGTSGLVDITTMGWPDYELTEAGLELAASCTLATLEALPARPDWTAHPLFSLCCNALLGSFKVWNVATVGGNICMSLPAGPMTSLAAALDAELLVWNADGSDRVVPAADFVTGVRENTLADGDVLRSITIPHASLRARVAFRKIALSPLGRSGTLLIGRLDADGGVVVTVTAGTDRPVQLRFSALPTAAEFAEAVGGIDGWYDDAHGSPDWRRQCSLLLGEEIRRELEGAIV